MIPKLPTTKTQRGSQKSSKAYRFTSNSDSWTEADPSPEQSDHDRGCRDMNLSTSGHSCSLRPGWWSNNPTNGVAVHRWRWGELRPEPQPLGRVKRLLGHWPVYANSPFMTFRRRGI